MNMPNDDLISREAAIEMLKEKLNRNYTPSFTAGDAFASALHRIKKLPAVDADPVHKKPLIASIMETMNHMDENTKNGGHQSNTARRGKWILFGKNHAKCSECKLKRNISTQVAWEYCPKCGTIMDFEEDAPCTP